MLPVNASPQVLKTPFNGLQAPLARHIRLGLSHHSIKNVVSPKNIKANQSIASSYRAGNVRQLKQAKAKVDPWKRATSEVLLEMSNPGRQPYSNRGINNSKKSETFVASRELR
ncbi:hypothetical protein BDP81DRAFT_21978 [Colletotrichum phormii]|uniref:Uncharacterized protein n=1 Tax=Colletotrichum phormii TaxID=359342 RepID=A0AAJ0A7K1_9PEZI|nr:uncharacterized protein BDP81DRAFT_21978 [Colletotrichum phormii]KAK1656482.1 hypothetical protein BDP81DRAFT_21978 [Colletotrichum phormii]